MMFGTKILENFFSAIDTLNFSGYLICTAVSLVLGLVIAFSATFRNRYTKSLTVSLVILPMIVQVIIALVNGRLGAGVAVAGAFSLVRFRSAPASARDVTSIFLAMTVGLAVGMGYIGIAVILTLIVCLVNIILAYTKLGEHKEGERELKIVIPESLNYEDALEEVFEKYTLKHELVRVKTTNMGSLYNLHYHITLRKGVSQKQFIDDLRVRNGNLEISCTMPELRESKESI